MRGRGAVVLEGRPKRMRPCLNCGKRFLTTAATRTCKTCSIRNADLEMGGLVMMTTPTRSEG